MSNIQILQTKLSIPPVRTDLVQRQRLFEVLNQGLQRKLTLVSAPAGFGKTTLLMAWTRICGRPVAWLSLDDGDNDPVRFLAYLIASLRKIDAEIGKDLLEKLASPRFSDPDSLFSHEDLLAGLINRLDEIAESFVFILDDYHVISAQPVHETMGFLLDHLPTQMHLVIASRADPPLPLARLRGRGQLNELRLSDLRFTDEEAGSFLKKIMGLDLRPEQLSALTHKTEGWIAGLQMAALSMQGREDLSSFIGAFTGSNRFILDYLIEEVLQRQPSLIQDFLLKTSILEQLSGPLCDYVLGDGSQRAEEETLISPLYPLFRNSQAVLEHLDQANLFIVCLDDQREWYRYHRLFSDLLHKRLYQTWPDLERMLNFRASEWFERHGYMQEAIEHAFSANEPSRAAQLVEQIAEALLKRSEVATLRRWLDRLPDEQVSTRPALCIYHAWILLMSNRPLEDIKERLDQAVSKDEAFSSKVSVLRAYIAALGGQLARAAALARQALKGLEERDSFLRSLALIILASSELSDGSPRAGYRALDQAARISEQSGNVMASVMVLASMAEDCRKQGQLRQVETLYQQALDLAVDSKGRRLPIAGRPLIGMGDLMRERNQLGVAERYLEEGIELIRQWGLIGAYSGYLSLVRLRQAQRDLPGALEVLEEARRIALSTEVTEIDDLAVAVVQASIWIALGDLQSAEQWVERRELLKEIDETLLSESERYVYAHLRKYEQLVLARLRLAQGRKEEALGLLDYLLPIVEKIPRVGMAIEIQVLRAIAFHQLGNDDQAMQALENALSMAEPGDYVRIFLDEGRLVQSLLKLENSRLAGDAPLKPYVERLLVEYQAAETESRTPVQPHETTIAPEDVEHPLPEPLSERELEVLGYLRSSLTVPEIAAELYIAESTVRSHVKSIYAKLGVHRRMDAVQRAKELSMFS
jgi:LuxR family maltose regulon positive regulatory protein